MIHRITCVVLLAITLMWTDPISAESPDVAVPRPEAAAPRSEEPATRWGIGLQGNFPLWGGLSAKYTGLGKVHIQLIEHYVQDGDEYSAMIGLQVPFTVADYTWTRVYIAPGVGLRRTKEDQMHHVTAEVQPKPDHFNPGMQIRTITENTIGGAFLFGVELFLDQLFGSGTSRYGVNIEFGQGIGRINRAATCKDLDGEPLGCEALYDESPWLQDDPNEKEGTSTRASFVIGFGFHIYF